MHKTFQFCHEKLKFRMHEKWRVIFKDSIAFAKDFRGFNTKTVTF